MESVCQGTRDPVLQRRLAQPPLIVRVDDNAGFDQNRLYLGGSHTFSPHVRAELGYLYNYVHTPFNRPARRFDVLLLTVNYTL